MEIKGYLRTSLIEWPGKISSVIFVSGCNFRCPFCHNSHLVDPKKIAKLPSFSEKEILAGLEKRRRWIEGVVITGGEPTLQPDLPEFLKKIKKLGFETMIETNGTRPRLLRRLVGQKPPILDYLSLDLKAPLDKRYAKTVGLKSFDPKIWIKSLKIILKSGIPFELRTTVVPGIHNEKVLIQMAKQLRNVQMFKCSNVQNWFLQNFQPQNCLNPEFEKIKPYSREKLEEFLTLLTALDKVDKIAIRNEE